jgi:hypothetical protein
VQNTGSFSLHPSGALRSTLESFIQHMERGEFLVAADQWHLPALVLGDQQVHGPLSNEHLTRWLGEAVPPPRVRVGTPVDHIRTIEWISERVAQVSTSWPTLRFGGSLRGIESTVFLLRIDELGHPRIRGLLLVPPELPMESAR